MNKYNLLFALMLMSATSVVCAAETMPIEANPVQHGNVIRGHVIEKYSEEHLPYATILILEIGQGAVTDESGHFTFDKISEGTYTLRVQLLGYATQEKKITGTTKQSMQRNRRMLCFCFLSKIGNKMLLHRRNCGLFIYPLCCHPDRILDTCF